MTGRDPTPDSSSSASMLGRLRRMSSARRGVLAIVGGTGVGQIVALAAAPLISRFFPPDVYGPFAVINALILPVGVLAALRYELAIPIPEDDETARAIVSVGMRSALGIGAILGLIVMAGRGWLADLFGIGGDQWPLLLWVPVVGSLMGAFIVLNQFAIRERLYGAIARRNLLQASSIVVFQLMAGLLSAGPHGLAAGLALGQAVGVGTLALSLRGPLSKPTNPRDRGRVVRTYRRFPLLMAPSAVANTLGVQAPLLLAAPLYGTGVAGLLGMTQRILILPVSLLGMAVAQVFLGEFGAVHRRGGSGMDALFLRTSRRLAAVALACGLVVVVLAPPLFGWVLGQQWERSGLYAQALAIGAAAQLVAAPLSQVTIILGRVGLQAAWDVGRLVGVCAIMLGAHRAGANDLTAMWALGVATFCAYLVLWLIARSAVRSGVSKPEFGPS